MISQIIWLATLPLMIFVSYKIIVMVYVKLENKKKL